MEPIRFVIHNEDGSQTVLQLALGSYTVGRDGSCELIIPAPGISRLHARLRFTDDAVDVEDLGSTGGTSVDNQPITSCTKVALPAVLLFGSLPVEVSSLSSPFPAPKPASPLESDRPETIQFTLSGSTHRSLSVRDLNDQTSRRLEMLYELPLKFAAEKNLSRLCALILDEVIALIPGAVRGALLVKDASDGKLTVRASVPRDAPAISRTLIRKAAIEQIGFIWGDVESDRQNVSASMAAIRIRTGMYAPLVWESDIVGVLLVDNPHRNSAFQPADLQFLLSVAHYAASALTNQLLQNEITQNNRTLQHLLANFSPKIRDRLLEKSRAGKLQPGGEKSLVTVLLSDLRGFTKASASLDADVVVEMLNDYFGVLGQEIFRHDGTIDKFIGDAILAVFGSPEPDEYHAWRAVCAAIEMQRRLKEINTRRSAAGLPFCEMGIGVYTGEVLHGFIGTEECLEYTVIGDTVNKASRYCDGAKAGEIALGPFTYEAVKYHIPANLRMISTKHEGALPSYIVDWENATFPEQS